MRKQGQDIESLYDLTELPVEFIKDPTSWLDAKQVENFLRTTEISLDSVGHAAKELKAWGVLDSVLRMIAKPQDIYNQPQRFISYFISPAPPVANIKREENSISFDLPISFEEYPLTASYILAAIEAIPEFMGSEMAEAKWRENRISIRWNESQPLLNSVDMNSRYLAPEVMQSLMTTLEKTEQALIAKTLELEKIKNENTRAAQSQIVGADPLRADQLTADQLATADQLPTSGEQWDKFQQKVMKLQDYFTRSQQLITLLIGQDRMSSQVREAMKRVNWDQVQQLFPDVVGSLLSQSDTNTAAPMESDHGKNHQNMGSRDSGQSWLSHS